MMQQVTALRREFAQHTGNTVQVQEFCTEAQDIHTAMLKHRRYGQTTFLGSRAPTWFMSAVSQKRGTPLLLLPESCSASSKPSSSAAVGSDLPVTNWYLEQVAHATS
jgi:hypothetical protein